MNISIQIVAAYFICVEGLLLKFISHERVREIFYFSVMMKFVLLIWYLPSHKEIFPISYIRPVEIDGVILASVPC